MLVRNYVITGQASASRSVILNLTIFLCLAIFSVHHNDCAAQSKRPDFMYGGDISALTAIEAKGGVYKDNGKPGDAIKIMQKYGMNTFRLRLFVNATMKGAVLQDLDYTLKLAKRIKNAGGRLILDLHYSDTWADPGNQRKPSAWESLTFKQLEAKVASYTTDVVSQFKKAGCLPEIIQIGNEIHVGMLWPDGKIHAKEGGWPRFTALLKAGVRGAKKPLGKGDNMKIMIHAATGGDSKGTVHFFKNLKKHGVPFDIIGLSYYPWWHGGIKSLRANMKVTARTFKKPIVVVETAYTWSPRNEKHMPNRNMDWPRSPAGQKKFLQEVTKAVKSAPNNLGIGVIWWFPESINVKNAPSWFNGTAALFDDQGNALPALKSWK